jgi:uroporphyrinogen-III synthase
LAEAGAEVLEAPMIEFAEPPDLLRVDEALRRMAEYHWVVLTSPNGVRAMVTRMTALGLDARHFAGRRIAAIGRATADLVTQSFLRPEIWPEISEAELLRTRLRREGTAGHTFLLLRSDVPLPELPALLRECGAAMVTDVPVYSTRPVADLPAEVRTALTVGQVDWVTFVSPSAVRSFTRFLPLAVRPLRVASIGAATTTAAHEAGLAVEAEAEPYTIAGLVEAIGRRCGANRGSAQVAS